MRKSRKTDGPVIIIPVTFGGEDREVLWRSGNGRVIRGGDIVKVDGLRGRWQVSATQQSFLPDALFLYEIGPAGEWLGGTRTIRPDRVHVKRAATEAAVARAAA